MFNSNSKEPFKGKPEQQNIIAKSTSLIGDIKTDGAFRIDGLVEGTLVSKSKVVIGKEGQVIGTLTGVNASIEGRFSGKLSLSGTLSVKSTANIDGEVLTSKLDIEPGAIFNVTCNMGEKVKTLKDDSINLKRRGNALQSS